VVDERGRLGDWEGDLITGRGGLSAIGTLVCRRSRYIKLIHLRGCRTAEDLIFGMHETLAELPESVRFTLTWDQGSEMAGHDQIAGLFSEVVFFAHAGKLGSDRRTRTATASCASTSPRAATYESTPSRTYAESRSGSTPARKTLDWAIPAQIFATSLASS